VKRREKTFGKEIGALEDQTKHTYRFHRREKENRTKKTKWFVTLEEQEGNRPLVHFKRIWVSKSGKSYFQEESRKTVRFASRKTRPVNPARKVGEGKGNRHPFNAP